MYVCWVDNAGRMVTQWWSLGRYEETDLVGVFFVCRVKSSGFLVV